MRGAQCADMGGMTRRDSRHAGPDSLALPPQLQAILEAEYPRFSDAEMARRRAAIEDLLGEAGVDHLVFCGANRFGSAVQWLTGWPVTTEAVGVLTPGEPDALFVQHVNHVPHGAALADRGGGRLGRRLVDRRGHRGAGTTRRARRPRRA